ncbi:MAG: hypothetical protein VX589_14310 [Myxococcota bacterium]|nr:hypothetical protein [Myxococcota bacterium]
MKTVLTFVLLCALIGCASNDEGRDVSSDSSNGATTEAFAGAGGSGPSGLVTTGVGGDDGGAEAADESAGGSENNSGEADLDSATPADPSMTVSNAGDNPASEPILDCAGACERYEACGKTVEVFGEGGRATCLDRCSRITRDGDARAATWWQCLAEDACSLISRCPVPSIEALECDEVCGLVDSCDVGVMFTDCAQSCADQPGIAACADALTGECRVDAFEQCLAQDVYQECGEYCTATVECNVAIAQGCEASCINTVMNGDALVVANFRRTNTCVQTAKRNMSCPEMNACLTPFTVETPMVPTEAEFCARYDGCNFYSDCADEYADALQVGEYHLLCIYEQFAGQCPEFYFEVESACESAERTRISETCSRYCDAVTQCSDDPQAPQTCVNECQRSLEEGSDEGIRLQATLGCLNEMTCAEFNQCVSSQSPASRCEQFCATRAQCGDIEDTCEADCDANWPRDRYTAWRDCVTAAGDVCDEVNACRLADTVPCETYCETVDACDVQFDRCRAVCDDFQFTYPDEASVAVGCTIAAAAQCRGDAPILSVDSCQDDPSVVGPDCINFCRSQNACDPFADYATCFTRCRAGLQGLDRLIFEQSRDCLAAKSESATCDVLAECTADADQVDCMAHCQQLTDCRVDRTMCVEQCGAEPPIDEVACVLGAVRTGQQCRGVAGCAGEAIPMVSDTCADFCTVRGRCQADADAYLCELDCVDEPPELAYQLGCLRVSGCDDSEVCLMLPAERDPLCNDVCAILVGCGAMTEEACFAQCTGQLASPTTPQNKIETVTQCLAEAQDDDDMCDAEAAGRCLDPVFCEVIPNPIFAPANGGRVEFNVAGGPPGFASQECGNPTNRMEGYAQQAIVVSVAQRSNASFAVVERDFDTVLSLRTDCDRVDTEIACNDDSDFDDDFLGSRIPEEGGSIVLEAGTYYLIVDAYRRLAPLDGAGVVQITLEPAPR